MDEKDSLAELIPNLHFLEDLSQQTPNKSWQDFFERIEEEKPPSSPLSPFVASLDEQIKLLAEAYRRYGHLMAAINPLSLEKVPIPPQLNLERLGFQEHQKKELFPTLGFLPQERAPLEEIVQALKKLYCQSVGFEFKGFTDSNLEKWIQQEIESGRWKRPLDNQQKRLILQLLIRADRLESFLHTRHVGKKRFSLEGGETLIPMLNFLTAQAAEEGAKEILIGMSHRGRLNVLANVLHKPLQEILQDFDEDYQPAPVEGMGDVRYHKGHANEAVQTYHGKSIKLTMASNPSHLESIDPVVEGQARAKQVIIGDEPERKQILPFLIHGDASLSGQGVVYETLQLQKLPGYTTGGTVHLVVNNQIGFTTSPKEARSTFYCTAVAYPFGSPVFHLNAEDPESCVYAALFALEIRQRFHCDVWLDLNCYRKYGHNEGDEPFFTQPLEYQMIRKKKSIREQYRDQLFREGVLNRQEEEQEEKTIQHQLQEAYQQQQERSLSKSSGTQADERKTSFIEPIKTSVSHQVLQMVAERFSSIPPDFHPHPKLKQLMQERRKAVIEERPIDWGLGEFLAYASLVWEGVPVRLVGQDTGRGTFTHRHALWVDQKNGENYIPLTHLKEGQGRFEVINSPLSEVAALGFEYGYSTVCQKGLTIWEAQFGDFANSAQVIIDQYMASGGQKWGQISNLVLFLPHGFEGQGPEHSSARLERFLSLTGQDNFCVVNPTTPAQLFHLLRRHVKQSYPHPLVVLTPKGLLRHPACVSSIQDLSEGSFHPILKDPQASQSVRRVIFCSGRIYYDLEAKRKKQKEEGIALIRIEQLYPLDTEGIKQIFTRYPSLEDCLWVQEEPENMGAWLFISSCLPALLPAGMVLSYVGRERSAAPATGFYARHKEEQEKILKQALSLS